MDINYSFFFEKLPENDSRLSVTSDSNNKTVDFAVTLQTLLLDKIPKTCDPVDRPTIKETAHYRVGVSVIVRPNVTGNVALASLESVGFKPKPS
ncbi:MAG: hypothetical protein NTX66_00095 [Candidatus Falkowbacteria bacterium]|nr:hypothetical protein [Candidatus Falkowbacteria bacterium]